MIPKKNLSQPAKHFKWFVCIIILFLIIACGEGSETAQTVNSDTGSINFSLAWENPETVSEVIAGVARSASKDVCVDFNISTITVNVIDADNKNTGSKTWDCDKHGGEINNIPPRDGYRLKIEGISMGNVMWSAERLGISVKKGEITTIPDIITMIYQGNDTIPPEIESTSPADKSSGVELNTTVSITFKESIAPGYINESSFLLAADGATVDGTVTYDEDTMTALFEAQNGLLPNTSYTATITTDVVDRAKIGLLDTYTWSFDTFTESTWYIDSDGDHYGDTNVSTQAISKPEGYVADNTDCNDNDENINPGASEVCDGVDNDCDNDVDEGCDADKDGVADDQDRCPNTTSGESVDENGCSSGQVPSWYRDQDGDSYGNKNDLKQALIQPVGYVGNNTDCNDGDVNINPAATEICDKKDNDCDGNIDEGLICFQLIWDQSNWDEMEWK